MFKLFWVQIISLFLFASAAFANCNDMLTNVNAIPDFPVRSYSEFVEKFKSGIEMGDQEKILSLVKYPLMVVDPTENGKHKVRFIETPEELSEVFATAFSQSLLRRVSQSNLDEIFEFKGESPRIFSVAIRDTVDEVFRFTLSPDGTLSLIQVVYKYQP